MQCRRELSDEGEPVSPVLGADFDVLPPRCSYVYCSREDMQRDKIEKSSLCYEVVAMEALLVELLEGSVDEELA